MLTYCGKMEIVTKIDNRGRILIPRNIRKKMGIKGEMKVLLRLKENNVIEVVPIGELLPTEVGSFQRSE